MSRIFVRATLRARVTREEGEWSRSVRLVCCCKTSAPQYLDFFRYLFSPGAVWLFIFLSLSLFLFYLSAPVNTRDKGGKVSQTDGNAGTAITLGFKVAEYKVKQFFIQQFSSRLSFRHSNTVVSLCRGVSNDASEYLWEPRDCVPYSLTNFRENGERTSKHRNIASFILNTPISRQIV